MRRRRSLIILIGLFSLFLLSGCVQLVQEMTVNADGSGSIAIAMGVESGSYEEFQENIPEGYELENLLASQMQADYVLDFSQDHYEEDGWTWDSVRLDVSDFSAMFAAGDLEIGPVTIELDESEDGYTYYQTFDMAYSTLAIPGVNLMDLSGASYTVHLNAPHITNTDGVQEAAGRSTWEVTLGDVIQKGEGISMVVDYVMTPYEGFFIPWDTFYSELMMGFLIVGILAIFVVIIVNTTGKRNLYHR
jgi:hypothetical protein